MKRLFTIAVLSWPLLVHADWRKEQWLVDGFTWALGGGPTSGPVAGVGVGGRSLCGDARGSIFINVEQTIDIVTPAGDRMRLAGTGELGDRDGPAHLASFRMGERAYYGTRNIACGPDGAVYVADSGNNAVRRIARDSGVWRVTTLRGKAPDSSRRARGGAPGRFSGTIAVAVDSAGAVVVADSYGAHRLASLDGEWEYLGGWPESTATAAGKRSRLNPMMGDSDNLGNVYFVSRTPDVVIKIGRDGRIVHLAGIVTRSPKKPHHIGDVAPREAYFDTPTSLVAAPDGSAVYVCGGDEYAVRRIPADGSGTTATLLQNGRWAQLSVHPNKVRGKAIVRPNARGAARPEGHLTPMVLNHMAGRDAQGNIYGLLSTWQGLAPEIEGQGPLFARTFRLRRTEAP
ncbi:MAG: hypothetical protein KJZ81_16850 [Burkholderiaceae bacterium]|nr:hypothetical protein [Burkholderiaceae bacterium]